MCHGGNNTLLGHENRTCKDSFPEISGQGVVNFLCSITQNDTSFNTFHTICCKDPVPTSREEQVIGLNQFVKNMCLQSNMTDQEFCNLAYQMDEHTPPEPFTITPITYVLMSLLTPIGILANILIIYTVLKCKKLRTTTGYFICNLAIADLLCILCMIVYIITDSQIQLRTNFVALYLFSSMDVLIGSASLLHVTAASLERAIAVAKPMVYPLILSKERAKKIIMIIWLYCAVIFIVCCLRIFFKTFTYHRVVLFIAVIISFVIPCVIVLISYINISIRALKNLQMEKRIERSLIIFSMLNTTDRKASRHHHLQKELKLALNLTVMTVPFVFGWGYFMIGNIYEDLNHITLVGIQNWILNMLPFLIACINPITYLLFTKTLRIEAIKYVLKPFKFRLLHQRRFSSTSCMLQSTRTSDCFETRMI